MEIKDHLGMYSGTYSRPLGPRQPARSHAVAGTYPSPIPVRRAWRGSAPLCAARRSPAAWAAAGARRGRARYRARQASVRRPPPPPAAPVTAIHVTGAAQAHSESRTIRTAGDGCARVCDSSGVNSSSSSSAVRGDTNGEVICRGGNRKRQEVVRERRPIEALRPGGGATRL